MRRFVRVGWLVVVFGALIPTAPARAQGFVFESTPEFDVNIVIQPSGDLEITETIVQEFGSTPRHGIFRYIPNRLRYDDEFDRVYPIDLMSVTASPPGTPDDVETKDENGNFVIRIGDPDTTITGRHTYEIVYTVKGAMNGFAEIPDPNSALNTTSPAYLAMKVCTILRGMGLPSASFRLPVSMTWFMSALTSMMSPVAACSGIFIRGIWGMVPSFASAPADGDLDIPCSL